MKSRFLFPHHFIKLGIILLILGFLVAIFKTEFDKPLIELSSRLYNHDLHRLTNGILLLLLTSGLLLIAFSKEKIEDEQIAQLRLDSLQWAVYFSYAILIICALLITSWHLFLAIATHYIFIPLVFFIIRFRWVIYQSTHSLKNTD